MKVIVDLKGCDSETKVLQKFGDTFEFGGRDQQGWGQNWDALNDSLGYLEGGGIWGTSKKFDFPLIIEIVNATDLQKSDADGYQKLQEILKDKADQYDLRHKRLDIIYS